MGIRETLIGVARHPEDAGAVVAGLSPLQREELLRAAVVHGLGTAVAVAAHQSRVPVPEWLETHRFDMANRRAHIMAALAALAPALTAAGIPWAVLKGPVVATYYPTPTFREFVDLDVLVAGDRLGDALDALRDAGMTRANTNWEGALRHGVAEFPVFIAGTPIDLHWQLIGLRRTRRQFRIPVSGLLARAEPVELVGVACRRLDPEDNAIHVALHLGLGGGWRLAGLQDVHEIVRVGDFDWDALARRALAYGAGPIVGHVLDRCREALGTLVPPGVAERLAPAPALQARRLVDRHYPHGAVQPFSGIVVSVARRGLTATLAASAEQLADRARRVVGREERWSAYDTASPLYWEREPGDPAAYEAYLRLAAGG